MIFFPSFYASSSLIPSFSHPYDTCRNITCTWSIFLHPPFISTFHSRCPESLFLLSLSSLPVLPIPFPSSLSGYVRSFQNVLFVHFSSFYSEKKVYLTYTIHLSSSRPHILLIPYLYLFSSRCTLYFSPWRSWNAVEKEKRTERRITVNDGKIQKKKGR